MTVGEQQGLDRVAILVDRDHDEAITPLLGVGEQLRAAFGCELVAVHVAPSIAVLRGGLTGWEVDTEDPERPVRRWLAEATSHVDLERVVLSGADSAAVIGQWAGEADVDLLLAASASTAIQRAALGSFVGRLAQTSPVPILVLPAGAGGLSQLPQSGLDVVCCVSPVDPSSRVVVEARRIVDSLPGAQLTFVHAVPARIPIDRRLVRRLLPPSAKALEGSRRDMRDLASTQRGSRGVVLIGGSRRTTDWIKAEAADLVVAGAGAPEESRHVGRFAQALCLHAGRPVLLVPES